MYFNKKQQYIVYLFTTSVEFACGEKTFVVLVCKKLMYYACRVCEWVSFLLKIKILL